MEENLKGVHIVTVSHILPLFKKEEEANAIEVIRLEGMDFDIVAQKGRFAIGDKAVYIMPDFNISDTPLFEFFIRPNGDPKKSRLGANYRVRASKFNLHIGDYEQVYSNGILFKMDEVEQYLQEPVQEKLDLDKLLGVTKFEEPESTDGNVVSKKSGNEYPTGIYKTGETNFKARSGMLNRLLPCRLVGTLKVDGSSITFGRKDDKTFIASRKLVKPLEVKQLDYINPLTFWQKVGSFLLSKKYDNRVFKMVANDDTFVKMAKPFVNIMYDLGLDDILFRGELNGQGLKGSGNKKNPSRNDKPNIKVYGADIIIDDKATRLSWDEVHLLIDKMNCNRNTKIETVPIIFDQVFNTKEELETACKTYFKTNLVEGIVIRGVDVDYSAKYMNPVYDSQK